MGFLSRLASVVAFMAVACTAAVAQQALPEFRYIYSKNTDFYGADLGPLFDTQREACVQACTAQADCVGFTYNTRSNACFPKSAVTKSEIFEGALSARKVATPADAQFLAQTRLATLGFLSGQDLTDARRLFEENADRFRVDAAELANVLVQLDNAVARGDQAGIAYWAGAAAALTDGAKYWAHLASVGLKRDGNTRYALYQRLRKEAVPAAINAYLRTATTRDQASALALLARAFEANGRGRDMIAPMRLANAIDPRVSRAEALDRAIARYGFRITDSRVENNSDQPRICAEFSETLAQGGVDFEPFVRVQDPSLVIAAGTREICIEGVRHGARYTATFRSGLPAASGEVLHKDVSITLYVRDRAPSVRFSGRSYVLPRSAQAALPIETVNTDAVALVLRRVSDRNLLRAMQDSYFGKPLAKYEEEDFANTIAQDVWTGTGAVQNALNTATTTRLPLSDALGDQPAGIYALTASISGADPYETPSATQWFVLTDLGLGTISGTDGMHVTVRSLGDALGRDQVGLTLISRANAVLGEAVTDDQGRAHFSAGLTRGSGSSAPALLMAQARDGDVAFLSLDDPAFDLSDRGVEGRAPAPAIDTFVTTDRGAYRVGETVFVTALTRDAQGRAISDLPLSAVLKRPDGAEYSRTQTSGDMAGGHVFALPIGSQAPRGAWRLDIVSDATQAPLSSQVFLVEDFLPDRIAFDMTLPTGQITPDSTPELQIDARYLFGAPAVDLVVEGEARLRSTRQLAAHQGYVFGRDDTRFDPRTGYLDPVRTDGQGSASLTVDVPEIDEYPSQPLELAIVARVAEGSGRPVEKSLTVPLALQGAMIGIKPNFEGVLAEGVDAQFDLIATAEALPVRWTLNRIDTQYQWYQQGGNWFWEPLTRRMRQATGEMVLGAVPTPLSVPASWGRFELVVEHTGAPYAVTSSTFDVGWYGGGDTSTTPDFLSVSLDQDSYSTGDTARLRLVAPQSGVAEIAVLSNRVIHQQTVEVEAGETIVALEVTPEWGTGAYVSATLVQPMDGPAGVNPARSLGLAHAKIAPEEKQLQVTLGGPDERDGQAGKISIPIEVQGIAHGETAYVSLAAVDVGILNLTGFTAPDPSAHYFGQRRLGVELRDVYGRLIDGLNGAMGSVRSGGDAAEAAQRQSPPPTEALMSFFSGPVTIGADGRAVVEVARPAFNGTIRLMAVAWSDTAVGNASRDIIARDPVVITASVPRLLAPDDRSRLLLELVHTSGDSGVMALDFFADAGIGLGAVPDHVNLAQGATLRLPLDLTAREVGDHDITVQLTTPQGNVLRRVVTLPVRINDPEIAVTRRFSLNTGETFTFDTAPLSGLRAGTARATLTAGALARFDTAGLLRQLDNYPYGCTEQVTSGALPLLYAGALAQDAGLGSLPRIKEKIAQAIALVTARQASNGAFGLWHAESGEFWLDAYVSDFLWQAQAQGHSVPRPVLSSALDNLRNRINYAPDFDKGGEDVAYALLVLARAGAAQIGDLRYYADTKAQAFATPLAAAQLGAALAAYGDPLRADKMFARAVAMTPNSADRRVWRDDFGSNLRDRAGVLALAANAQTTAINVADFARDLRLPDHGLSTQEAAQIVMAAYSLQNTTSSGLQVDGLHTKGTVIKSVSDRNPTTTMIRNTAASPADITLTTFGVPLVAPAAGGYGYAITRRYFTTQGEQVTGPVATGTRLVAVLEVQSFEETGARLMIDDPLPGGFEIDNPNLLDSAAVAGLPWLQTASPENVEFRADRFLAAVDHSGKKAFQIAYMVRAITPGTYHHPAAIVSDMYRPEYRANTATDRLTVIP